MNDDVLHQLWSAEQMILDEIHRICSENSLKYSLAYGTLLGAVRHAGFIPWDDDIDILMPREDYDRFISIFDQVAGPDYVLVTDENSPDYNNNFAKVKKDHTAFIQSEAQKTRSFHKGIFVDVFPMDRRAPKGLTDKIQFFAFALNLLYNRGYSSGAGGVLGLGERVLLGMVPKKHYRKTSAFAGRISRRWNGRKGAELVAPNRLECSRFFYPADAFDRLTTMQFNGKEYSAFQDYDTILRIEFGDYMTLPPEDERVWRHHPLLIDFEHNYEELT